MKGLKMTVNPIVMALASVMVIQANAQTAQLAATESGAAVSAPQAVAPSGSPIFILNNQNQKSAQRVVQEQPVSVVEDTALVSSTAEVKRKKRQALEVQTEQKIVEKLEEARMEEERLRAERIFGGGFGSGVQQSTSVNVIQSGGDTTATQTNGTQQAQPIQVVAPAPAPAVVAPAPAPVVVAPVPAPAPIVVTTPAIDQDLAIGQTVREEVRAALKESIKTEAPKSANSFYISGVLGMGHYPDVVNVRNNWATGVTIGMKTAEGFLIEGGFVYSNYDIELMTNCCNTWYPYPAFKELRQYNTGAAVKYSPFSSWKVQPNVGAQVSYTYRTYLDRQFNTIPSDSVSTSALDAGLSAGVDVALTDNFSLGFDMKYFTNIYYREDSDYMQSFVNPDDSEGTRLERLNYYTGLVSAKFTF